MKHRNKKEKVAISIITRTERSKRTAQEREREKGGKSEGTRAAGFAAMKEKESKRRGKESKLGAYSDIYCSPGRPGAGS